MNIIFFFCVATFTLLYSCILTYTRYNLLFLNLLISNLTHAHTNKLSIKTKLTVNELNQAHRLDSSAFVKYSKQ